MIKLTIFLIIGGDAPGADAWCGAFGTREARDAEFTNIITTQLQHFGRKLEEFESEADACDWLDLLGDVDRPTTEEQTIELPFSPDHNPIKLGVLIEACQEASAMAPKPEVPMLEDMDEDLDPNQVESLCYDAGLYHAAQVVRDGLRAVGVEPVEGTTEWYHEDEEAA